MKQLRLLAVFGLGAVLASLPASNRPVPSSSWASTVAVHSPAVVAVVTAASPPDDLWAGQICGGVLVTSQLVLTAAHCVANRSADRIDAVINADQLCRAAPIGGERRHVRAIIVNPEWSTDFTADAALLLLDRAAAEPSARSASASGTLLSAVGWGRANLDSPAPCRRRAVPLAVLPMQRCAPSAAQFHRRADDGRQLCLVATSTQTTCTGDSGSPVMAVEGTGLVVVAIVSWAADCRVDTPGLYVRAAPLAPWILRVARAAASH